MAGWVADADHLVHHDVPPLLPKLLPILLKDTSDFQAMAAIAAGYKQIYQALEDERRYWVPELALQLAQSLAHLPDRALAQDAIDYSIDTWLQLHQAIQPQTSHPLEAMQLALNVEDEAYLLQLRDYFKALGDSRSIAQVENNLNAIADLKLKSQLEYATVSHTLTAHTDKITSIALSPDGETLVSGSIDKTIGIWNVKTGKLIRTLKGDAGEVASIAISPDGLFLAIGSHEHPKSNVKVGIWVLVNCSTLS